MTIESGLSDHHKLISVLTTYFKKKEPVKINYRSYKNFDETAFRNNLLYNLQNCDSNTLQYDEFKDIFMKVLNHHAPNKQKVLRGNSQPFMNKVLSTAFIHRSKLKNQHDKNPNELNKGMYKKQRNFCVTLLRREKKKYYNNLNLKIFQDNKKFWQRIKPLFSNIQIDLQKNIIIVENDKIISSSDKVAENLNNFFIGAVEKLEIESYAPNTDNNIHKSIDEITKKYEMHPSILEIRKNVNVENKFVFTNTTANAFKDEINKLYPRKAGIENDIPAKILISTSDIVCTHLSHIIPQKMTIHIPEV